MHYKSDDISTFEVYARFTNQVGFVWYAEVVHFTNVNSTLGPVQNDGDEGS